ncbi:transposase [Streptomyces sp. NPDC018000]|uniref:transposase n=1 Tax=Streptomyces sp. NPDC018000 TaxID=3365028 RepID=UPI00379881BD
MSCDCSVRAAHGVGPDTAAQLLVTAGGNPDRLRTEACFAALRGPVPDSSGRTNRHRLPRRRPRSRRRPLPHRPLPHAQRRPHPRLRHPADRRRTHEEGDHPPAPAGDRPGDLPLPHHTGHGPRRLRPAAGTPGQELHPHHRRRALRRRWPAVISCIERGTRRDDDLAGAYRDWLTAA